VEKNVKLERGDARSSVSAGKPPMPAHINPARKSGAAFLKRAGFKEGLRPNTSFCAADDGRFFAILLSGTGVSVDRNQSSL
jgi:hypothetical protein